MKKILVREAAENEAEKLTELACRAKAHWGYSAEFLELCKEDLTVSRDFIRNGHVGVAIQDDSIVGFFGFSDVNQDPELVHIYVEPNAIGTGTGKILWQHAVEKAKQLGWKSFKIISDPHAKTFYEKMGAVCQGEIASPAKKDRLIPWLIYTL